MEGTDLGMFTKEEILTKNLYSQKLGKAFPIVPLLSELFDEFFKRYQNYLKKRQELDFADLISKSTEILNKTNFKTKFKRIIVDEYQDISRGRYRLLQALINKQNDCRIMCVGDDWQSIYRFAGGEIGIMVFETEFEKYFGKRVKNKKLSYLKSKIKRMIMMLKKLVV